MDKVGKPDNSESYKWDLKVCDNGTSAQILYFWALATVLSLSKNRSLYFSEHSVSETGFILRLQVKPNHFYMYNINTVVNATILFVVLCVSFFILHVSAVTGHHQVYFRLRSCHTARNTFKDSSGIHWETTQNNTWPVPKNEVTAAALVDIVQVFLCF
jgi:hypothetical protein